MDRQVSPDYTNGVLLRECERTGGRVVVPFRRGAFVSVALNLIDGGVR